MEMYRSGHNGAHSKCVSPPGLMGSNPIISARTGEVTPIGVTSPVFLLEKRGIRTREGTGRKRSFRGKLRRPGDRSETKSNKVSGSEEYKMTTPSNYLNSHF